jgi:hypothetical protein
MGTREDGTGMGGLGFVLKVCFAICILADILFYISFLYFIATTRLDLIRRFICCSQSDMARGAIPAGI